MFLVIDQRYGTTCLVFTWEDPRKSRFTGDVVEGVSLNYDMEAVHRWPDGDPRPEVCVGRDKNDPRHYQVFRYRILHLPKGAPPDEIRLLEVDDRLAGSESHIEAVDFGLDVGGTPFRLYVADIPHAVEDGTSSFNPEPTATACITERRRRWLRVKRANGNRVRYITTEELLRIRQDPSRLPPGWSIDGATNRGRRAA